MINSFGLFLLVGLFYVLVVKVTKHQPYLLKRQNIMMGVHVMIYQSISQASQRQKI